MKYNVIRLSVGSRGGLVRRIVDTLDDEDSAVRVANAMDDSDQFATYVVERDDGVEIIH